MRFLVQNADALLQRSSPAGMIFEGGAVLANAASVILCHNHPSGDCEPSSEDIRITKRLAEAGKILGIEVLDHVIFGNPGFASLKERNII